MQIALIPHVVWNYNDDRIPLQFLYNEFKGTGRVVLIEDHNAEELKVSSPVAVLVASRTHASHCRLLHSNTYFGDGLFGKGTWHSPRPVW